MLTVRLGAARCDSLAGGWRRPNDKASTEWHGMCRVALAPPARSGEGYKAFLLFCQEGRAEGRTMEVVCFMGARTDNLLPRVWCC